MNLFASFALFAVLSIEGCLRIVLIYLYALLSTLYPPSFPLALLKQKRVPNFFGTLLAVRTGLEPVTPCVTGMYSNQLN